MIRRNNINLAETKRVPNQKQTLRKVSKEMQKIREKSA